MKSSNSIPVVTARDIGTTSATAVEITGQQLSPITLVTVIVSLGGVMIGLNQLNP
jgi:hypothetical protein